jgi:hypothetical protein
MVHIFVNPCNQCDTFWVKLAEEGFADRESFLNISEKGLKKHPIQEKRPWVFNSPSGSLRKLFFIVTS